MYQIFALMLMLTISTLASASQPTQIPLEDFFKDSKYRNAKISPTGEYLAISYDEGTQTKLAIVNMKKNQVMSGYEFGINQKIFHFTWANDERLLMQYHKSLGNFDKRNGPPTLVATNADGSNRRELFRIGASGYELLSLLPEKDNKILIGKYHWTEEGEIKVHEIDINKGKLKYVGGQPRDAMGIVTDTAGNLRVAYSYEEEDDDKLGHGELTLHYKPKATGPWHTLELPGYEKGDSLNFLGFDASNKVAYFTSDMKAVRNAVYSFNIETTKITKLLDDPIVDINGSIRGPEGEVIGFSYMPDISASAYINPSEQTSKLLTSIEAAFPGETVRPTSYTKDGSHAVVVVFSDKNAGEFYLFDTQSYKATYLSASHPQLDKKLLADMQPIKLKARDGVELHGYLTLPKGKNKNLPMIVNPHGGPHGPRDQWRFMSDVQFFANRGYAVLQINFRGSGGYGKKFMESGYRKWGREMQDDITDATLWAVEQGYADKDRLCIYGGSYGGYASLMGVVREPDLYKCSVGYVGVYDLAEMYKSGDIPRTDEGKKVLREFIGEDQTELKANSPAFNVDKIKAALYLVHGRKDYRVPMSQLESLTDALDKAGKRYKEMVRDEGHGYQLEKNKYELYAELEKFFAKHIGS